MNLADGLNPPLLTPDLAGVGGCIKREPEDFEVEEIPAYEPSGTGEHLFLWVEKRDMGAEFFARQVARRLAISPGEVGTAGLKDRHAVARQWVSVPATCEAYLAQLNGDGIRVLNVSRHANKLKPGHLRGNRFRILIRDARQTELTALEQIAREGMPNYYGPQRFGHDGETALLGLALLRGEPPPPGPDGRHPNVRSPFLRKLALSAAQSLLFNQWLAARLRDGLLRTVLAGDVMAKWPAGGMFNAEDVAAEQARLEAREIVPTGPMFGKKTFAAKGMAAEREATILGNSGLSLARFGNFGKLLQGTRRHAIVYPEELSAEWEPDGLRLRFTLPAGSYATVLLREVMKSDVAGDEPDND